MISIIKRCSSAIIVLWLCAFVDLSESLATSRQRRSAKSKEKSKKTSKGFGNPVPKASPTNTFTADASEPTRQLLKFLDDEEVEGLEVVELGFEANENGLRGVFCKEPLQKGDYICAIPFVSTVLIDETFFVDPPEERLTAARLENAVKFLEFSKHPKQHQTDFQPYLDCLPQLGDSTFDPTPDFWSEEEIRQLEIPRFVEEMIARKRDLERMAKEQQKEKGDVQVTCQELQHAAWLVRTRAFTTLKKAITLDGTEGLLQRTVMIPFLDMINHDSQSQNAELQVVETKEYEESFYALTATKPITRGSQIQIGYGTGSDTSLELFGKYGFLPTKNEKNDLDRISELLKDVKWSTSLKEDQEEYDFATGTRKTILSIRIYFKELQSRQK